MTQDSGLLVFPPVSGAGLVRRLPRLPPAQNLAARCLAAALGFLMVMLLLDPPLHAIASGLDPQLHALFRALARLGNSAFPLGFGLAALLAVRALARRESGRRRLALRRLQACIWFVILAVAASGLIASLLKNCIGRARPSLPGAGVFDFTGFAFHAAQASFPSGHATTAVAMMVALSLIVPRLATGAVAFGGLIALSRCLIGVHWFSDVLAGAALGAAVTLALRRRFDAGRDRPMLSPAIAALAAGAILRALSRLRAALIGRMTRGPRGIASPGA